MTALNAPAAYDEVSPSTRDFVDMVARICHEANRAYCIELGDDSQVPWDDAPDWQRDSARDGVLFHVANPVVAPADSHGRWLRLKVAQGWKWGPEKDPEKKLHPCIVPWRELPWDQRMKDVLFTGIVRLFVEVRARGQSGTEQIREFDPVPPELR